MALVVADRVKDTTTTTGTGTVTLSGTAPTGYQNFAVIGNGNTTYYTIAGGSEWEVGVGTYATSGPTLARTTVLASTNGGNAVSFSAGTKDVFVTYPAEVATALTNPVPTNGGVVYGTGTAIGVSAAGVVNGYQFLQSAGAASPTWVQINSFKDVATAPTSPTPIEGDRFFDNTTGIDYTYITDVDGSQWVETSATGAASNVYTKTTFTATASQTTFTLNYNVGYVDVYLNGVKLTVTDFTASSGTTVVLAVAAALNDIVETIAWTTWAVTNTAIGAGTGTSLALNGATLGSNALAVSGTAAISGAVTGASLAIGGATLGSNALAVTGSSLFPGSTSISSAGLVGVGMTPSNVLDITQTQNAGSIAKITNANAGTGAIAYFSASNGTSTINLAMFGTGYTSSGVTRSNGGYIGCGAAGGLTFNTEAAQPIYFGINNAEVARIDTSGRLCVGGTTAEGFFTLNKASPTNGRIAVFTNGVDANIIFPLSTGSSGIGSGTTTPFLFYTDGSERARFGSNGHFGINCTSAIYDGSAKFSVDNSVSSTAAFRGTGSGNAVVVVMGLTANSGYNAMQFFVTNVGVAGSIVCAGGGSTAYNTSSDYRLKDNVQPMTGGLATVAALKPVTYDWISNGSAGEGFIAHELQAVIPAAVSGEKDAVDDKGKITPQGVDFGKIVPHLVAAIQELTAQNDDLTTRLAALEAK